MGSRITFKTPDGGSADGYLAPAAGAKTAVVVIQEWWGLNDQIERTCDRFAGEGYTALSPDLYKGRMAQDADEANHMMTGLDWGGATNVDIAGAIDHLRKNHDHVAVMGFCMGGALTILSAVHLSPDAAVCFYGIPPKEAADPATIKVPFQGHFAELDDWCTPAAADALEDDLKKSGTVYEMYRYPGAQHGFFNDTTAASNPEAAELAWPRMMDFLKKTLG